MSAPPLSHQLKLVLFCIDTLNAALPSSAVREIIHVPRITTAYHSPPYVRGVINLRGTIVSVLDMRIKLGFVPTEIMAGNRIVIASHSDEDVGLLVDAVDDVLPIDESDCSTPPANLNGENADYISAVIQHEDNLITILDLDKLVALET
ncbi:MAG: chemotaxis protein CheW [Planctomycetota bacterium]|jgi:purine-binding chemotaxis protein CheW